MVSIFMVGLALTTFLEFTGLDVPHLDTMFALDSGIVAPGRMSIQSSVGFMVSGISLTLLSCKRPLLNRAADTAVLLLCLYIFCFTGSLFFSSEGSPGWSLRQQLAPHTFFCFTLLTLMIVARRTRSGFFSILVDYGIGGKTARRAAPVAILLPFLIATLREAMVRSHFFSLNYAIAIAPALTAVLALILVLLLALRNRDLETAIRELSMRDDLTGVYNRRGFNLLAQQVLNQAHRNQEPFCVLFIDVDNLKHINDSKGHELGSEHLKQIAELLRHTFRDTDVIGRVGGDEFIVASRSTQSQLLLAVERLHAEAKRFTPENPAGFPLCFSFGIAEYCPNDRTQTTLDDLIHEADHRMYQRKREKKLAEQPATL